jgi:hypothetical protein
MSGAFAGGAAQGLSSGLEKGRERQMRRQAQDLQNKIRQNQLDLQRRRFKIEEDKLKIEQDTIKRQEEARKNFFETFGINMDDAADGATQTGPVAGPPQASGVPSVAAPGLVSEAEGRAAGARDVVVDSPVPPQTPTATPQEQIAGARLARGESPDGIPVISNEEHLRRRAMAEQAGMGDFYNQAIENGTVPLPLNHARRIELATERLGLEKDTKEFRQEQQRLEALGTLIADMGEAGDPNSGAAMAAYAAGDFERAAKLQFPNIEAPKNAFELAHRIAGDNPERMAQVVKSINANPSLWQTISDAESSDPETAARGKRMLAQFQSIKEKEAAGDIVVERDGTKIRVAGDKTTERNLIKQINNDGAMLRQMDGLVELMESNPAAFGSESFVRTIEQQVGDLAVTARGLTGGDDVTKKLIDRFQNADIAKAETRHAMLTAAVAKAFFAPTGVITEGDMRNARELVGATPGSFRSLLSNPAKFRVKLQEMVKVREAALMDNIGQLSESERNFQMERFRGRGGVFAGSPAQAAQPQPANSAPAAAQGGSQQVTAQPQAQQQPLQRVTAEQAQGADRGALEARLKELEAR